MVLGEEAGRLYGGPPHRWQAPLRGRPFSFALFTITAAIVLVELVFVGIELLFYGFVFPSTARMFAFIGIVLLLFANAKSIALPLFGQATDSLKGILDVLLDRLWLAHFWLNPVAVFSLGLFLLFAPRAQPPFYYMAYGVLVWQTFSGLLAREALPVRRGKEELGRNARAAHHQPAIYVLLLVLVAAGFVDSLFP